MTQPHILLLTALRAEATLVEAALTGIAEDYRADKRFVSGYLADTYVVTTCTGMGKVNATMIATLALLEFRPSLVLGIGIAGAAAPDMVPGDVIIAPEVVQVDFASVTAHGYELRPTRHAHTFTPNPIFFPAAPTLVDQIAPVLANVSLDHLPWHTTYRLPVGRLGRIATTDLFAPLLADRQRWYKQYDCLAIDMESAAFAQVCWTYEVPYLTIRGISDTSEEPLGEIELFAALAMQNVLRVVAAMLAI